PASNSMSSAHSSANAMKPDQMLNKLVDDLRSKMPEQRASQMDIVQREIQKSSEDMPIVQLVDAVFKQAVVKKASDIHIEPFKDRAQKMFNEALEQPNGMILVTGPTGSGKSTTLYTGLTILNSPERNIVTLEDPVEYQLARINQVQVNTKVGLTFAKGLRSILRQDPDIIMVGEIRDQE